MEGLKTLSPKQWDVFDLIYSDEARDGPIICLYGGAGFSGKSHLIRILHIHHHCHLHDQWGIEGPRTVIACRELQDVIKRHSTRLRGGYKELGRIATSGPVPGFHFHNPALGVIEFWHLKDTDSFRSNEYYGISVDEASENPRQCANSEATLINDLLYPIRSGLFPDAPMFLLLGSNPDGPGHAWLKDMFVDRTDLQGYDGDLIHFIKATLDDHPNKRAAAQIKKKLSAIENVAIREARLNGSWDFPDGMRFKLDKSVHQFRMAERFPMGLPGDGDCFIGYDWGLGAPFCALYAYREPGTGDIYIYREVYKEGLTISEQARLMMAHMREQEVIRTVFADETIFLKNQWLARHGRLDITVADDLRESLAANRNIGPLVPADVRNRAGGFSRIDSYLDREATEFPNIYIEEGCYALWGELKGASFSKKKADVGDIDESCSDHALTALYFILRSISNKPKSLPKVENLEPPARVDVLLAQIERERKLAMQQAKRRKR